MLARGVLLPASSSKIKQSSARSVCQHSLAARPALLPTLSVLQALGSLKMLAGCHLQHAQNKKAASLDNASGIGVLASFRRETSACQCSGATRPVKSAGHACMSSFFHQLAAMPLPSVTCLSDDELTSTPAKSTKEPSSGKQSCEAGGVSKPKAKAKVKGQPKESQPKAKPKVKGQPKDESQPKAKPKTEPKAKSKPGVVKKPSAKDGRAYKCRYDTGGRHQWGIKIGGKEVMQAILQP